MALPSYLLPLDEASISEPSSYQFQTQNTRFFYNLAKEITGDEEAARVLTAIAAREGLTSQVGDRGRSFGPLQFHVAGELQNFAKWLGQPLEVAKKTAIDRWDLAVRFAWETYLGRAYQEGLQKGLQGPDLATYMSQVGQRSIKPELSGMKYKEFFGEAGGPSPFALDYLKPLDTVTTVPGAERPPTGFETPKPEPVATLPVSISPTKTGAFTTHWQWLTSPTPTEGWPSLREGLLRTLGLFGIPQRLIEQTITGQSNFEQAPWVDTLVSRLAPIYQQLNLQITEKPQVGRAVPPKQLTEEEARKLAKSHIVFALQLATDPLLFTFWARLPSMLLSRLGPLANFFRIAPKVTPEVAATLPKAAEEIPSTVIRDLEEAFKQARIEQALRGRPAIPAVSTPEAPITVTPEGIATPPLLGEPTVPVPSFPTVRGPGGRFQRAITGHQFFIEKPLWRGGPADKPYDIHQPRTLYMTQAPSPVSRTMAPEAFTPDMPTETVSIWVMPLHPKALPAPVDVKVNGPLIDIVRPTTSHAAEIADLNLKLKSTTSLLDDVVRSAVATEPKPLATAELEPMGWPTPIPAPPPGSTWGRIAERFVSKENLALLSRVEAALDRMGPAGRTIRITLQNVIKDTQRTVGEQVAKVITKMGLKEFPRLSEAEWKNLDAIIWEGAKPISPRVAALHQALLESLNQDARQIILQNRIPGYIPVNRLKDYIERYGINPKKIEDIFEVEAWDNIEQRVVRVHKFVQLPAEEWVKVFQPDYFARRYNWVKLQQAYRDAKAGKLQEWNYLVRYLVQSKQAFDPQQADVMLRNALESFFDSVPFITPNVRRPLMHFQYPRTLPQLPKEYMLPAMQSWLQYWHELGTVLAYQKHLGPGGEVIKAAYQTLASTEGINREFVENTLRWAFGKADAWEPYSPLLNRLMSGTVLVKMTLSSISQTGQMVHIYSLAGAKNLAKALRAQSKFGYVDAYRAGAILSPTNILKEASLESVISERFLTTTGFLPMDRWLRSVAYNAGKYQFDDVVQALARDPNNSFAKNWSRLFRESMDKDIGVAVSKLSPEVKRALAVADSRQLENLVNQITPLKELRDEFGYFMANESQFRGGLLDRPLWANSALGKFILAIRGFSYRQAAFVNRYLLGEAARWVKTGGKEGSIGPLVRFLAAGLPWGAVVLTLRTLIPALVGEAVATGVKTVAGKPVQPKIKDWEDIRRLVEARLVRGDRSPLSMAAMVLDTLGAVGAWGIVSDTVERIGSAPTPFRVMGGLQAIVGVPASTTLETAFAVGSPLIGLYNWWTAPAEEKLGKQFMEEWKKEWIRAAGGTMGTVAGLGPVLRSHFHAMTPQSQRLHYIRLIKRAAARKDMAAMEYWLRKMYEDLGDIPEPSQIDAWIEGR